MAVVIVQMHVEGFEAAQHREADAAGCDGADMQEMFPERYRGWTDLAINGSFWIGGALGAAASIFVLDPTCIDPDIGWRLPEAVALITDFVLEGARDGRSVADLMETGGSVLAREQVMEGIAEMLPEVQVEATFPDGSKLVTVHEPIR